MRVLGSKFSLAIQGGNQSVKYSNQPDESTMFKPYQSPFPCQSESLLENRVFPV